MDRMSACTVVNGGLKVQRPAGGVLRGGGKPFALRIPRTGALYIEEMSGFSHGCSCARYRPEGFHAVVRGDWYGTVCDTTHFKGDLS